MKEALLTRKEKNFSFLHQPAMVALPALSTAISTLVEFFDEFHPREAQKEICQLCHLAVTTDNSTYETGYKRSNLLHFSEKLHELVTACHVIAQLRDRFIKDDRAPDKFEEPDDGGPSNSGDPDHNGQGDDGPYDTFHLEGHEEPPMPFDRPPLLPEYLPDDPEYVLHEVFTTMHLYDLREDYLPKWLKSALANGNSAYEDSEERTALMKLYDALLPVVEALHLINEENRRQSEGAEYNPHPDIVQQNAPVLLNEHQLKNPLCVVREFCRQFPLIYVRRELFCFVNAAVANSQNYPPDFSPDMALVVYINVLPLVEAAYILCEDAED